MQLMQEKKPNQYAVLLGLKIINYITNVKNVKKRWLKSINGLIKKFPNIHKWVFILINTWIVRKDLMKHHYPMKKLFTVN